MHHRYLPERYGFGRVSSDEPVGYLGRRFASRIQIAGHSVWLTPCGREFAREWHDSVRLLLDPEGRRPAGILSVL